MVEMSIEQRRALAMAKARQAAEVDQYNSSPVPQFLSGMNEGAANLLSLPNSVEMGLRSIGPGIVNAFGGNAEMPTESWLPDAGASYRRLTDTIGAVKPETDDGVGRFARRVGEEVGAMAIPAIGAPGKVAALASAVGSGAGAAIMEEIAPGNPFAEMAGQAVGGFTPLAVANAAERAAMKAATVPSIDELQIAKSAAYDRVDNLGVAYTPGAYDQLVARMEAAAARESLVPARHSRAQSVLEDFKARQGQPITLTQLDKMRQIIGRDLAKSADGSDRFFGRLFADEVDDFIAKASPAMVSSGNPAVAQEAILAARELNQRFKRAEAFDKEMYNAEMRTEASGSGGNINNATRQRINSILLNPNKRRQFSPEQLAEMERVVRQGQVENVLRTVGKVAPSGNGLMTALNVGAIAHNPAMAAVPVVGTIAKAIADSRTAKGAAEISAMLARGGKPTVPALGPQTEKVAAALLASQAANQNERYKPIVDALMRANALN